MHSQLFHFELHQGEKQLIASQVKVFSQFPTFRSLYLEVFAKMKYNEPEKQKSVA